jgi:hypothetical protein
MSNYDQAVTDELVAEYQKAEDKKAKIAELARKFNKSEKSIIGKLARLGIYQKQVYVSKTGELPETKKEIIARISTLLNLNPERVQGLEKAPKSELRLVEQAIILLSD